MRFVGETATLLIGGVEADPENWVELPRCVVMTQGDSMVDVNRPDANFQVNFEHVVLFTANEVAAWLVEIGRLILFRGYVYEVESVAFTHRSAFGTGRAGTSIPIVRRADIEPPVLPGGPEPEPEPAQPPSWWGTPENTAYFVNANGQLTNENGTVIRDDDSSPVTGIRTDFQGGPYFWENGANSYNSGAKLVADWELEPGAPGYYVLRTAGSPFTRGRWSA